MTRLASVSLVLSMAAGIGSAETTLTFDQAVALAGATTSRATTVPLDLELDRLRRWRLPNVRIELAGNKARTLDLFSEGPFEIQSASSVLAFDYPLWDGGAERARLDSMVGRLRRIPAPGQLDDTRFAELLDAFGELHLVQRQYELIRPLSEEMSALDDRSKELLSSGEISNLTAVERREIALSFSSQLLDLEARRLDAATKLRLFTGIEEEPAVVLDPSELALSVPEGDDLRDDQVDVATIAVEENRARLRGVSAANGIQATLSGYAGVGAAESEFRNVDSDGSFGVYGVRVHLSYPLLRGTTSGVSILEARADLEQSLAIRERAIERARTRASQHRLREESARQRIALLRRSVEAAKEREGSLQRLVTAGIRSASDLASAQVERTRRELDLLATEVERWKLARLIARMTTVGNSESTRP